jgi:hypothetical protein
MAKAELVFIPLPGVGHLLSTLEIAKLLLQNEERISITVLIMNRPSDPKQLAFDQSLGDPALSKRIRFVNLPYKGKFSGTNEFDFLLSLIESHKPNVREVVTKLFKSELGPDSPKLAGFVVDMFCTSMIEVATELGVPSYVYFTSGACTISLMLHLQSIYDEQGVDFCKLDSNTQFKVPGFVNPVPIGVFPRTVLNKDTMASIIGMFRNFRETKGILINTFDELEYNSIRSLSDIKSPIPYHVGPLLNLKSHGQENNDKYSEIMNWLDNQPQTSVVFLCFGSLGTFGEIQIKEIALALERSGHRFLWSLRQPTSTAGKIPGEYENLDEVLPQDFLNRTAEIGKIIGWAPQVAVLAHPAVGGFVSHCGWNSILESIWFGVPIASWPIYAEQQVNAFTMVKELGLAVDIKMDYWKDPENEIIVSADLIERGINGVMELDSEVRKKMKETSEKGRKATICGGSSYDSLGNFIEDVMNV